MQKAAKSKRRDEDQKFSCTDEDEDQQWETILEVDVEEFDCPESLAEIDVELLEEFEDDSDAESLHADLEQAILTLRWYKPFTVS